jgi:hypothetical protein
LLVLLGVHLILHISRIRVKKTISPKENVWIFSFKYLVISVIVSVMTVVIESIWSVIHRWEIILKRFNKTVVEWREQQSNENVTSIKGRVITGLYTALYKMNTRLATLTHFTKWSVSSSCVSNHSTSITSQYSSTNCVHLFFFF